MSSTLPPVGSLTGCRQKCREHHYTAACAAWGGSMLVYCNMQSLVSGSRQLRAAWLAMNQIEFWWSSNIQQAVLLRMHHITSAAGRRGCVRLRAEHSQQAEHDRNVCGTCCRDRWLTPLSFLPVIGPAIYLVLRPKAR